MIEMREADLNQLCENYESMKFKAGSWWPTVDKIKTHIEPKMKSSMKFAIWITETADDPKNDEEKEAKKYLLKLIYKNLKITDEGA